MRYRLGRNSGEGVLGLRRGFIQAGAQNLLITLWPIRDDLTVQVMLDFYQHAFATDDAPRDSRRLSAIGS
ncbi:MAG TPA: CHAT domain-containing protein [Terrimicrobiaceae bacterium]